MKEKNNSWVQKLVDSDESTRKLVGVIIAVCDYLGLTLALSAFYSIHPVVVTPLAVVLAILAVVMLMGMVLIIQAEIIKPLFEKLRIEPIHGVWRSRLFLLSVINFLSFMARWLFKTPAECIALYVLGIGVMFAASIIARTITAEEKLPSLD